MPSIAFLTSAMVASLLPELLRMTWPSNSPMRLPWSSRIIFPSNSPIRCRENRGHTFHLLQQLVLTWERAAFPSNLNSDTVNLPFLRG